MVQPSFVFLNSLYKGDFLAFLRTSLGTFPQYCKKSEMLLVPFIVFVLLFTYYSSYDS